MADRDRSDPVRRLAWRGGLALALVVAGWLVPAVVRAQPDAPDVPAVRVDGPITAVTADYIDRALGQAEAEGADAFLIELDTPGGDLTSMLAIGTRLLNAKLPTVVWVGPQGAQAASAGTFVVLAAHAAGMAPRTVIGAASPVGSGGADLPETAGRKVTEDMSATARAWAKRRGEDAAEWAESAVREAASAEADEALALGVIDAVADTPALLLASVDGLPVEVDTTETTLRTAGAVVRAIPMNPAESLLSRLVHPAVALILLTLGVNAILIELSNPGGFVAGTIGALSLVLAFYSLGVLEANLVGLVFMAGAFLLFILETQAPSFGLLTAGGILLFVVGAVLLFQGGYYDVPWRPIAALALTLGLFFALVVGAVLRALRRRPYTGADGLIGQRAEVRQALAPRGKVFLLGELWDGESESGAPLPEGAEVEVVGRDGYRLRVRPFPGPPTSRGDD